MLVARKRLYKSIKFERDIPVLVRTAKGETNTGTKIQEAGVVFVILNRLFEGKEQYGHNIYDVCMKKNYGIYQFSYWGKTELEHLSYYYVKDSIYNVLETIDNWVSGNDFTNGANHYHAYWMRPYWAAGAAPVYEDGMHKFYKL